MRALEIIGKRLRHQLSQFDFCDAGGQVANWDLVAPFLEGPGGVYLMVSEVETVSPRYANKTLGDRLSLPSGHLSLEQAQLLIINFDPPSFMHILDIAAQYREGSDTNRPGALTIAYTVPLFWNSEGKVTYYANVFQEANRMSLANAHANFDLGKMTQKQGEVLAHLLDGLPHREIARTLGISPKTLEKHCAAVFSLTGCQNQAALIQACSQI